jgi:SAM-dependent methyltransferase
MPDVSAAEFWEDLYAQHGDGWELGQPAPPLVEFIEATPPPLGRVAVPGCGRGHDVRYLASRGYVAVGFDFSPAAIRAARTLERLTPASAGQGALPGGAVAFEQRDLFSLARDYFHALDGVWEYTCFCAIDPRRRAEYVRVMDAILKPGGWFLACFFPVRRVSGGPPFPVSKAEVRRLLAPHFRIERASPPLRSVRPRQGREWMVLARKVG